MDAARLVKFDFKGKEIVAGLFWQPLERPRAYMAEARQIGRKYQMDIVTIRHTDTVIQAGFVAKRIGGSKGMYSLAAILADRLGTKENDYTFIAVVPLAGNTQKYAMVAVNENAILPDSDRIGDFDDIKGHLERFYSRLDKPDVSIFAPAAFQFGGTELQLDTLLDKLDKRHQLKPLFFGLSKDEMRTFGATAAVVLVALVVADHYYQRYRADRQRQAQAAHQQSQKVQHDTGKATSAAALTHPWTTQPTAIEFVARCTPAIDALPLSFAGWVFVHAACTTAGLDARYARIKDSTATLNDFTRGAHRRWPGVAITYSADDTVAVHLPLTFPAGGDDSLLPAQTIHNDVISYFQRLNVIPAVTSKAAPIKALPGQPSHEPVATWTTYSFAPQSQLPPDLLLKGLPSIGVRLSEISVDLKDIVLTWHYQGAIYGK